MAKRSLSNGKRAKRSVKPTTVSPEEARDIAVTQSSAVVATTEAAQALKPIIASSDILTFVNEASISDYDGRYSLTLHDTVWYLACDIIQAQLKAPKSTPEHLQMAIHDSYAILFNELVFILQQCYYGMKRTVKFDRDLDASLTPWLRMGTQVPRRVVPYLQLNTVPTTTSLDARPMIFENANFFFASLLGSISLLQKQWSENHKTWSEFSQHFMRLTREIMIIWRSKNIQFDQTFALTCDGTTKVIRPKVQPVSYANDTALDVMMAQMMVRTPQACAVRYASKSWVLQPGFEKFSKQVQNSILCVPIFSQFKRTLERRFITEFDVADLLQSALDMAVQPDQTAEQNDESSCEVSGMEEEATDVPLEKIVQSLCALAPDKARIRTRAFPLHLKLRRRTTQPATPRINQHAPSDHVTSGSEPTASNKI